MSIPACANRASGIWFDIAVAGPCSGHGQCINGTGLCLCDDGWNGANDLFDFRVRNLGGGQFLSMDCNNPMVAQKFFWGIFVVFSLFRQIVTLYALYEALKKRYAKHTSRVKPTWSQTLREKENRMPLILMFDQFVANPLCLIGGFQKAIYADAVIGTDPGVTTTISLGVALSLLSHIAFTTYQFKVVTSVSSIQKDSRAATLYRRYRNFRLTSFVTYVLLATTPSFLALLTDKSKGPIENLEYAVMLSRNLGVLCWMTNDIFANHIMMHEVHNLKTSMGLVSSTAVTRVIAFMEEEQLKFRKQLIIGFAIYLISSIPFLWPFQTYQIAIGLTLGSAVSNLGMILLRTKSAAAEESHTTGSYDKSGKLKDVGSSKDSKSGTTADETVMRSPKTPTGQIVPSSSVRMSGDFNSMSPLR